MSSKKTKKVAAKKACDELLLKRDIIKPFLRAWDYTIACARDVFQESKKLKTRLRILSGQLYVHVENQTPGQYYKCYIDLEGSISRYDRTMNTGHPYSGDIVDILTGNAWRSCENSRVAIFTGMRVWRVFLQELEVLLADIAALPDMRRLDLHELHDAIVAYDNAVKAMDFLGVANALQAVCDKLPECSIPSDL